MAAVVAIPTRTEIGTLKNLVGALLDEQGVAHIAVMDNGHTQENALELAKWEANHERLTIYAMLGAGIYQMWNFAVDLANDIFDADRLLLLNDDITIPRGMVNALSDALTVDASLWAISADYHPRAPGGHYGSVSYVHGTFKDYGMAGFAFMFDPQRGIRFDEKFGHWYGDDDFVRQIEVEDGRVGVLNGVTVGHVGGATSVRFPELAEVIAKDGKYFDDKWGL